MKDLLEDFETFFNAHGASLVYRDTLPDSPDACCAVYEYGSNVPITQVAGATRSVQVVARAKSPTAAKEQARALYNALETDDDNGIINLTGSRWGLIVRKQLPFKMKVDEQERTLYAFNLDIVTYTD